MPYIYYSLTKRKKIFKCILCLQPSLKIICNNCQKNFLIPDPKIKDGAVSFYDYAEIESLIRMKYSKFGHRVYKILAENSLKLFAKTIEEDLFVIPVDDKTEKGYSHTAVLAHAMKTGRLTPLYGVLHAGNTVKYAAKSLTFRLENPRNFTYKGKKGIKVILVDDVITTGLTLDEAEECLKKHGVSVVLKAVLCDLRR